MAIVADSSGTVDGNEYIDIKDFAKDTVAAFADRNLFENGGTASFAQFSHYVDPGETFSSQQGFDDHVDSLSRISGSTAIALGIAEGRRLLANAPGAIASFMVVMTDGRNDDWYGDPKVGPLLVVGICANGVRKASLTPRARIETEMARRPAISGFIATPPVLCSPSHHPFLRAGRE